MAAQDARRDALHGKSGTLGELLNMEIDGSEEFQCDAEDEDDISKTDLEDTDDEASMYQYEDAEDESDIESNNGDFEDVLEKIRPVIAVERGEEPIVEWDENDKLLSGAFPHLFLLGRGPPKGSMKQSFLNHCFRFYDGRFEDPIWIATAFNQKQRHACIRNTARVSSKNPALFEMLGKLANSKDFKDKLIKARDDPDSDEAKRLNAKICRIFSMVGKAIPFSPFERASTRPMLAAMQLLYSTSTLFHTGSPPEFEDLTVL